jgi:hypothetical protein
MNTKQPLWKKLFSGGGWTLFTVFIWEMMEELLEEAIAFGITSFITKALSTLVVIGITQITKRAIIRICKPIVKTFTYKEGKDKMGKVKTFFTCVWSNKKTLLGLTSGAVMTLSGAEVIDVNALPELPVGGFNITPILYYGVLLVLAIFGMCGKGFESIKTHAERIAGEKAEKQEKAIIKEAKAQLKAEEKLANQTQAQKEKETAKKEAEDKAKAEKEKADAEHKALVEQAKAKILAEKQANSTN